MREDSGRIYLDHNATTQQTPEVTAAVVECMERFWANPSSIHLSGQLAKRRMEEARGQVASLIGAEPDEIVFTSGGSESVNAAIRSALAAAPKRRVVLTSEVEHSAVRELLDALAGDGVETIYLGKSHTGRVDPEAVREVLSQRGDEIALVTVMWANNETGVIEPIEEIAEICDEVGVPFHSDATQWIGKMPTDVKAMPVTMLSCAGHKFHGPKGTGVLWAKRGTLLKPCVIGGGQEQGRRGGTEHVPGIVGLGVAASQAENWIGGGGHERMVPLRDHFEAGIAAAIAGTCVNGATGSRMWSTSSIGFPDLEAELLLLVMSERGLDASAGSACASGALKHSAVLEAMGRQPCQIPKEPYGSVRFSWCRETTKDELERSVKIVADSVAAVRGIKPPSGSVLLDKG
ncbi:MAG: aminotransferase class V-fold PLP-dependent enzyme [Phycisphaerales bacterium]|jgi:cysteine desulfurase|nr:aminotransferase class V-fold PLP-dependent enzyme [Phycisphaerales bacterium]